MSPRPYRIGRRQAATDQTRARIVAAAHDLLSTAQDPAGFSIDAIARKAGVARMTVYYQFGSKSGLMEALFDSLAARGHIGEGLTAAFRNEDALAALDGVIAAFAHFWASDRLIIRRLHGLAVLDPEIEDGERARNERRRDALRTAVGRVAEQHGRPTAESRAEVIDILHTLTSFETFDILAGVTRGIEEVTPQIARLARTIIGLESR